MNWYISQSVQQDRGHRVLFPRINKDLIHCLSRRQSQGFSQCHLCYCRRVVGFLFILSTNLGCAKARFLSVEGFRTWLACLLVCLSMYSSMLHLLFIQRRLTKGILWLRALFFVGGRVHALCCSPCFKPNISYSEVDLATWPVALPLIRSILHSVTLCLCQ